MSVAPSPGTAFAALRRFAKRRMPSEACELCSCELTAEHEHLFEAATRKLICSCQACAILFPAAPDLRYKRVPRRILFLPQFQLSDTQWNGLMLPVNIAFLYKSSLQDRIVALYPSPAGATESLLELETWREIQIQNPLLGDMEADVEALLLNRVAYARGQGEAEYYITPVDRCFKLTGLIRANWRGLSGGAEVWREIAGFFAELKAHSSRPPEGTNA